MIDFTVYFFLFAKDDDSRTDLIDEDSCLKILSGAFDNEELDEVSLLVLAYSKMTEGVFWGHRNEGNFL